MNSKLNITLITGSAPDALMVKEHDLSIFSSRVVINNAWQLTKDWNYLIFPEDFSSERLPPASIINNKKLITAHEFIPEQNFFGGIVYGGGTMAFTAGYWALGALKPDVIAYLGCDMIYADKDGDQSHFYGNGKADPLRSDITLQSLEAKSVRLMAFAQLNNCTIVNLSNLPKSRLLFPRTTMKQILEMLDQKNSMYVDHAKLNFKSVKRALNLEEQLAYTVPSGRYWEHLNNFDSHKLSEIDSLWLNSVCKLN